MLFFLPKQVPTLDLIIEDIGSPRPAAIAKALDVSERTVERWIRAEQAPRAALLALFWITRWGRSQLDAELAQRANLHAGLVDALQQENRTLRTTIEQLTKLNQHGAANEPSFNPGRAVPARPRPGREVFIEASRPVSRQWLRNRWRRGLR